MILDIIFLNNFLIKLKIKYFYNILFLIYKGLKNFFNMVKFFLGLSDHISKNFS